VISDAIKRVDRVFEEKKEVLMLHVRKASPPLPLSLML
jgi:hypothetical protein